MPPTFTVQHRLSCHVAYTAPTEVLPEELRDPQHKTRSTNPAITQARSDAERAASLLGDLEAYVLPRRWPLPLRMLPRLTFAPAPPEADAEDSGSDSDSASDGDAEPLLVAEAETTAFCPFPAGAGPQPTADLPGPLPARPRRMRPRTEEDGRGAWEPRRTKKRKRPQRAESRLWRPPAELMDLARRVLARPELEVPAAADFHPPASLRLPVARLAASLADELLTPVLSAADWLGPEDGWSTLLERIEPALGQGAEGALRRTRQRMALLADSTLYGTSWTGKPGKRELYRRKRSKQSLANRGKNVRPGGFELVSRFSVEEIEDVLDGDMGESLEPTPIPAVRRSRYRRMVKAITAPVPPASVSAPAPSSASSSSSSSSSSASSSSSSSAAAAAAAAAAPAEQQEAARAAYPCSTSSGSDSGSDSDSGSGSGSGSDSGSSSPSGSGSESESGGEEAKKAARREAKEQRRQEAQERLWGVVSSGDEDEPELHELQ